MDQQDIKELLEAMLTKKEKNANKYPGVLFLSAVTFFPAFFLLFLGGASPLFFQR
jgi:hypothetical protein